MSPPRRPAVTHIKQPGRILLPACPLLNDHYSQGEQSPLSLMESVLHEPEGRYFMEAKIAAARPSPFKQPGGFKQRLEHFEAREGLKLRFSGVTGDAAPLMAVERH